MKLLAMNCGHCGAPLEVPPKTRFVTCMYCSSQLEIHRSGGAAYTEVLEAIQAHTAPIARDVKVLKLQQELTELDRQWMSEREKYLTRGEDGVMEVPEPGMALAGLVAVGIGGIVMIVWVFSTFTPFFGRDMGVFLVIAVLGVSWTIIQLLHNVFLANEYERLHQQYEQRRASLCQSIQSATEQDRLHS